MDILYIGGAGRSGSTVLDMILGNLSGFFSVGEILDYWELQNNPNILCGCGNLLRDCDFWSSVFSKINSSRAFSLSKMIIYKKQFDRTHRILFPLLINTARKADYESFLRFTSELYFYVYQNSNQSIIVDSSKTPAHLRILEQLPDINLHVLHLVRDPRAVAFSWYNRNKPNLSSKSNKNLMDKRNYINSIFRWIIENKLVESFGRRQKDYAVMKYEDFSVDPSHFLKTALNKINLPTDNLEDLFSPDHLLHSNHGIGGNPIRFNNSNFRITLDRKWADEMPRWLILALGILTLPMLKKYSYSILPE